MLWPMRDSEWLEWRAEREAGGVSGEHAWVGMFVDDLVCAAADDELVSVGGVPRLDETGAPVHRAAIRNQQSGAGVATNRESQSETVWRINVPIGMCTP